MEKTTPLIITDKTLQKHHFNQEDFVVYQEGEVFILVEKEKIKDTKVN